MVRLVLITVLGILVTGCASTSPSFAFRPANHKGAAWAISAKAENGAIKSTVTVMINNEPVVSGVLHALKSKDSFVGTYQDHKILAECLIAGSSTAYQKAFECDVFVDNERATRLQF